MANQLSLVDTYNSYLKNTIMEVIGIEFTDAGDDFLVGSMPVDHRTHQPFGILHGGASAVLAETLGSMLSYFVIDKDKFLSVGTEINCNHLKSKSSGTVFGKAVFVKKGRSTHLIKVEITDEEGQLICYSHLSTAIIPKERIQKNAR